MREQKEMMLVPKSSCNGGCESSHCVVKSLVFYPLYYLFLFYPLSHQINHLPIVSLRVVFFLFANWLRHDIIWIGRFRQNRIIELRQPQKLSSSKVTYPKLDKLTYPTSDLKEVLTRGLCFMCRTSASS